MKISYNWLRTHFTEKLPSPVELAERITMRSSEVEGVETVGDDTVLDIKILPDRAHYALSHRGVAYEVAAITGLQRAKTDSFVPTVGHDKKIIVTNAAPELCRRYMGCLIENISVTESEAQLKNYLEAVGARSINSIVDATNFTMFDVGQPLHAFDADKIQGGITIRKATNGEKITLLDGREVELDATVLVIADDVGPLAIAGVKGGKRAEVTSTTTRIFLEAANFEPATVRRTSTRLNLRNDSSKRFENEITAELASSGLNHFLAQITKTNPNARIGEIVDVYTQRAVQQKITLNKQIIDRVLGVVIPEIDFEAILTRLEVGIEKSGADYILTIPYERLDMVIAEDVAEEVGRLYGYDKVPSTPVPASDFKAKVEPSYYVSEKIKNILQDVGFSEIITQTLGKKGDLEVAYPVAKDRGFLRKSLSTRMSEALDFNIQYAALLGQTSISMFEIGKAFTGETETLQLAIGYRSTVKAKKGIQTPIELAIAKIKESFGEFVPLEQTPEVVSIDLGAVVSKITIPEDYGDTIRLENKVVTYTKISPYPYITRDIAVFVPSSVAQKELETIIDTHAGVLMIRRDLFDVFSKEDKTSYAFRIVFQSMERTLTDDEINPIMQKITEVMNANSGWQVR